MRDRLTNGRLVIDGSDGRPEAEFNFTFFRQRTNKTIGISDEAGTRLRRFFSQ